MIKLHRVTKVSCRCGIKSVELDRGYIVCVNIRVRHSAIIGRTNSSKESVCKYAREGERKRYAEFVESDLIHL